MQDQELSKFEEKFELYTIASDDPIMITDEQRINIERAMTDPTKKFITVGKELVMINAIRSIRIYKPIPKIPSREEETQKFTYIPVMDPVTRRTSHYKEVTLEEAEKWKQEQVEEKERKRKEAQQ